MLSKEDFIRLSNELNLFFLRIMKEHSIFLEAGFPSKNADLAHQADMLKNEFSLLLSEAIGLSNNAVSEQSINSGEFVTKYTLQAEKATQYYTGIFIDPNITGKELSLIIGSSPANPIPLANRVSSLNQRILHALDRIINYKTYVRDAVLNCKLYAGNYPLLIDHILREAVFYRNMIVRLQSGEEFNTLGEMLRQEQFWNRIMAEHAKFIRGLLDPTEQALIDTANNFAKEFDALTTKALNIHDDINYMQQLTTESLKATSDIRNFKAQGTEGLINCKIKSLIFPLLADHTLREASHFLRLLNAFS